MKLPNNQELLKHEIQATEARIIKVKAEIMAKQADKNELLINLNRKQQQLKELVKKEQTSTKPLRLTDHARLRYLERMQGIDVAGIDAAILNPQLLQMVATLGPKGKYPIGNCVAVVENNVIITIKPQ